MKPAAMLYVVLCYYHPALSSADVGPTLQVGFIYVRKLGRTNVGTFVIVLVLSFVKIRWFRQCWGN